MASDSAQQSKKYYDVLGLSNKASACAIRNAFKKLAMKWHPDKCSNDHDLIEAKAKFQAIQEAYAVLSDERKKMLYDSGIYNPNDNEEDIQSLGNFIDEISDMMKAQTSGEPGKGSSFQELQQLFVSMFGDDIAAMGNAAGILRTSKIEKKRHFEEDHKQTAPYMFFEACQLMTDNSTPHCFYDEAFDSDSSMGLNSSKKSKTTFNSYDPSTTSLKFNNH